MSWRTRGFVTAAKDTAASEVLASALLAHPGGHDVPERVMSVNELQLAPQAEHPGGTMDTVHPEASLPFWHWSRGLSLAPRLRGRGIALPSLLVHHRELGL